MKLVDTSVWVNALRHGGDELTRERLRGLIIGGQACWCSMVRLELWAGVGRDPERRVLREYEQVIPELPINDEVWQLACELACRCRQAGKRAPTSDLLIAACARYHKVEVEAADSHFEFLMVL
ncbi:MAG: PIN domain-containing protein [Chthoniobacteraceae bacterium]